MNEITTEEAAVAAARARASAGRPDLAEQAWLDVLREFPGNLDALNFLAVSAHARGRRDQALALFERAVHAHPDDPVAWVNLAMVRRELGQLDAALEAMRKGTALAPDLFAARLRMGEILQALGRNDEALPVYFGAIMSAQDAGQWRNPATTPPELRPLVQHAIGLVNSGRKALFGKLLDPLRDQHGGAALARVEKCISIYLGELPANYPDPRQKPTFLYFPGLPTQAFFSRDLFPWYAPLEEAQPAIRDEMLAVMAEDAGFEPFLGKAGGIDNLLDNKAGATPVWDAYFFERHGHRNTANAARCPVTAAAIDAAPLCRIRDHSPEVCFSKLTGGSHILPHRGVTNTRLTTHLPLVVPEGDLALHVSGEMQRWQEGRCFSFDDSFEHEAWNRSDKTRVVVLMDAWNPFLTEVERDALTTLIGGIGDFNRAAGR